MKASTKHHPPSIDTQSSTAREERLRILALPISPRPRVRSGTSRLLNTGFLKDRSSSRSPPLPMNMQGNRGRRAVKFTSLMRVIDIPNLEELADYLEDIYWSREQLASFRHEYVCEIEANTLSRSRHACHKVEDDLHV